VDFDMHWYAALEEVGNTDFYFHDLRRTTAAMLAAQGGSQSRSPDVLSHKTFAMVQRYPAPRRRSQGESHRANDRDDGVVIRRRRRRLQRQTPRGMSG
jgi:integrase